MTLTARVLIREDTELLGVRDMLLYLYAPEIKGTASLNRNYDLTTDFLKGFTYPSESLCSHFLLTRMSGT
jgi:hypothetical protein